VHVNLSNLLKFNFVLRYYKDWKQNIREKFAKNKKNLSVNAGVNTGMPLDYFLWWKVIHDHLQLA